MKLSGSPVKNIFQVIFVRNVECKKEYFLQNVLSLCITFLYVLNKYYILDFERLKLEEKIGNAPGMKVQNLFLVHPFQALKAVLEQPVMRLLHWMLVRN